ncbi:anaphase-promoting complex subunit [Trifolium repens]|nr:anaphase-promoting complex subunit [Trifolium repens]
MAEWEAVKKLKITLCCHHICLNWEEDSHVISDDHCHTSKYEDRTFRFFPPAPKEYTTHSFFLSTILP